MDGPRTDPIPPSFLLARWCFLRGLALVLAIAFLSLLVQIDGLVGSRGLLPVGQFLELARAQAGGTPWHRLPTLCWLDESDRFLHLQCLAGIASASALFLGFAPRAALFLSWALYLSLVVAGQEFLSFQWDALLLETTVFAIPFAPGGWRPRLAREAPPSTASLALLRWLLFRLMFASGVVKLTSGDPTWGLGDLSALTFHYWSQPLPTVGGWYAAHLPLWFQKLSCACMYAIEIGLPWLIFGTRRSRQVACWGFVLLQLLIALTGNYGFFNLLSLLLCLPLLDDAFLLRCVPGRLAEAARAPRTLGPSRRVTRIAGAALALCAAVLTGIQLLGNVRFLEFLGLPRTTGPIAAIDRVLSPFRSLNDYGLFRVMTKERREIEVQGSDDGATWTTYPFRWKPGTVDRAPGWVQPHMPRLDWQMWFAALGPARHSRWFRPFLERLLEGSPAVLGLLDDPPFRERPPRQARALLYDYRFTSAEERAATGAWWTRREVGVFVFPMSLR